MMHVEQLQGFFRTMLCYSLWQGVKSSLLCVV